MAFIHRFNHWLECHWVAPAYAGWVLLGLALFFFAAATNTLAGWLYVMSGVLLALLLVAAILPPRNLQGIKIQRQPMRPVSVGNFLRVELQLTNTHAHAQGLLQVIDPLPVALGCQPSQSFGLLAGGQSRCWQYDILAKQRGIYQWNSVDLRSAAPVGLFWCRRSVTLPASAVIYPQILPLNRCPLLDHLGQQGRQRQHRALHVKPSTEGITRSLRPYRWGDPTRLIHWRTSARYGELRVRELEQVTIGREVCIGLNTQARWQEAAFEQAVVVAASLFVYGFRQGLATLLWMPQTGILQDYAEALSALAVIQPMDFSPVMRPDYPMLWLTNDQTPDADLPPGSRQLCWGKTSIPSSSTPSDIISIPITMAGSLQEQLEASLR
jgi:uncharacterized protein (DUF58 family)